MRRDIIEEIEDRAEFFSVAEVEWLFFSLATAGTSEGGAPVSTREERADDVVESAPAHQFPILLLRASGSCVDSPVNAIPRPRFHQLEVGAVDGGDIVFGCEPAAGGIDVVGCSWFVGLASSEAAETDIMGTSGIDSKVRTRLRCPSDSVDSLVGAGLGAVDGDEPCPSSSSCSLSSDSRRCNSLPFSGTREA